MFKDETCTTSTCKPAFNWQPNLFVDCDPPQEPIQSRTHLGWACKAVRLQAVLVLQLAALLHRQPRAQVQIPDCIRREPEDVAVRPAGLLVLHCVGVLPYPFVLTLIQGPLLAVA